MPPVVHLSLPVRDLAETREFYEEVLQCPIGRVRDTWLDVWFFGMQLTLQEHPEQVLPPGKQGVRHFGAVLDRADFEQIRKRLSEHDAAWSNEDGSDGKKAVKVTDPSGNVVEFKYYEDQVSYRPPGG